ncbi:MAG: alpha/beta hydrolase [Alphaproteobacteria bacterium]|nr:alpha/beta hydrolase [Alphaproteobacteria bacterium]MDP6621798.1 alpha/beta hydrolase [Alphaproteobacteria bacterium]
MTEPGPMICDGPEDAEFALILAHGAGAPMDSPFMVAFAEGLAAAGQRVVRFEFPYMRARRGGRKPPPNRLPLLQECWLAAIAVLAEAGWPSRRLVIGGKSLGGRVASLVADQAGVAGLVCLGYPFHPAGRPEKTRTEHLAALATPTLIVQGTRDTLGSRQDVANYNLTSGIRMEWLEDGDHSFKPRRKSGRTEAENWQQGIDAVAAFVADLNES